MPHTSYLFTDSHEWIESSGAERRVGISHHAQQLMGDIVFADLPAVGKTLAKGEEILVIESPKAAASVYAPVAGEIVAVNDALSSDPALINRDPHGEGWIVKIKPTGEPEGLKTYADYEASIS